MLDVEKIAREAITDLLEYNDESDVVVHAYEKALARAGAVAAYKDVLKAQLTGIGLTTTMVRERLRALEDKP